MEQKMDLIYKHWKTSAQMDADKDGLMPTIRDPYMQQCIENCVKKWLHPNDTLLDIGCGVGKSSLEFSRCVKWLIGMDYIDEHIAKAKKDAIVTNCHNTEFVVGNVLDLSEIIKQYTQFDIITTIRCLINLSTWEMQKQALAQIASCMKKDGLYLACEGWREGIEGINLHRARLGLEPMQVVDFNRFMSRYEFEVEARKYFDIVEYISLGFYLFMSRVFQPLFVLPEKPSHVHHINKIAEKIQEDCSYGAEFNDCDYAGVYVLRRKSDY